MDKDIVLLDLFSGIGGFSLGLDQAGFNITNHYYSEIDKHAIAIYKYQFKHSSYVGSVTTLDGRAIDSVDLVTFGFPCQDLSIAGKRLGFEGQRSSLFYQATRVLRENQAHRFIWENVAGLMSSNGGQDIKAVFEELYLSGYVFDVDMMNTSWFLPQNRQRLYSVGVNIKYLQKCLLEQNGQNQNYSSFVKIMEGILLTKFPQYLTEVQRQSEQRQNDLVLEYLATKEQNQYRGQILKGKFSKIISTLPLKELKSLYQIILQTQSRQNDINSDLSMTPLLDTIQEVIRLDTEKKRKMGKEKFTLSIEMSLQKVSEENLIVMSKCIILTLINKTTISKTFTYAEMQLNIELFTILLSLLYPSCWNEALSNLIEKKKNINYAKVRRDQRITMQKNSDNAVQLSIGTGVGDDLIGHLATGRGDWQGVFPIAKRNRENDVNQKPDEATSVRCLSGGGHSGGNHSGMTLLKMNLKDGFKDNEGGGYSTLQSRDYKGYSNQDMDFVLVEPTHKHGDDRTYDDVAPTIQSRYGTGGDNIPYVINTAHPRCGDPAKGGTGPLESTDYVFTIDSTPHYVNKIRRLTEIECERLQGFPDGHTEYGDYDGIIKKVSKSQRYKCLGNAITVDVVREIGKRLLNT